jgi:ribosomal protein L37E
MTSRGQAITHAAQPVQRPVCTTSWNSSCHCVFASSTYGGCALLRYDLGSTTVSFVIFAALFGGTAAFLGHEVADFRRCPRCGAQQTARPGECAGCGYDVAARSRWVCDQGHGSYEPGVCDCGRRRQPYVPPDVGRRVARMVWFGAGLLAVLVATGLLLGR